MGLLRCLLVCALTVFATVGAGGIPAAYAQEQQLPNYTVWQKLATAAEKTIEGGTASNGELEVLRAEIATWREQFLAAEKTNADRIVTLKSQIAALGPVPVDGATETPEIAARRKDLNEQLARLQEPVIAADEAYTRANGIVGEIDRIIRERQATELLQLGPSPLSPSGWTEAAVALASSVTVMTEEVVEALDSPAQQADFRDTLPKTLGYLLIALILLLRSRKWMENLSMRMMARDTSSGHSVSGFFLSLGQIVVPMVGVYALVSAVRTTGLFGDQSDAVLKILPFASFAVLLARWLGGQVFAKGDGRAALLTLPRENRKEGRLYASLIGVLIGTSMIAQRMLPEGISEAATVVVNFPFLVLVGLMLFRIGQLMRAHSRSDAGADVDRTYRNRLISGLGQAIMVVGIGGPVLAAIGYYTAATAMVVPTVTTLAMLAILALLQRMLVDLYGIITRRSDNVADSLVPFLIGFMLLLAAIPLFALIWGARMADLTEIWAKFREGFTFGETRISPTDFITFAAVFAFGYMLTRFVQGVLRTTVLPKTQVDTGGRNAIVSGTGYIGIFAAALMAITTAGIDLSSLAIVAGALSVGIGFGLQNIVSNFVSGIILLIERPISEGDWIEVGGQMGYVRDISVRSTRIETFDRTDVIVPNADLVSGVVTNWTRGNLTGRAIIPVGVAYGTDTRKVEAILREIAEAHPMVSLNPPPNIFFIAFGADSLNFEIRAILRDVNWIVAVKSDINHEIAARFAAEGIEIPFAQRDIWIRNPEALTGTAKKDVAE